MRTFAKYTDSNVAQLLLDGALGILPTDTLYGIVASAKNQQAVERLYVVRRREANKACIILADSLESISDWIETTDESLALARRCWPGPVSIIFQASSDAPAFLPQFESTLAFRVPADEDLRELLAKTGPLVAPSANPAGEKPAETLTQAQHYFGEMVDFYVDGGDLSGRQPSALVRAAKNDIEVLRGQLPV